MNAADRSLEHLVYDRECRLMTLRLDRALLLLTAHLSHCAAGVQTEEEETCEEMGCTEARR